MTPSDADVERFRDYYDENPTWGSLHIVMDDYNTLDSHVQWCIRWAQEHGDDEGAHLGSVLLGLTEDEREQLSRRISGLTGG